MNLKILASFLLVALSASAQVRVPGVLTNGGNAYPVAPVEMISGAPQIVADMTALSNVPSWLRATGQVIRVLSPVSQWRFVGGTNNSNLVEGLHTTNNLGSVDIIGERVFLSGGGTDNNLVGTANGLQLSTGVTSGSTNWLFGRFGASGNKLFFGVDGTSSHIQSSVSKLAIGVGTGSSPNTNDTPTMTISSTLVGIGTTTPVVQMDVSGVVRALNGLLINANSWTNNLLLEAGQVHFVSSPTGVPYVIWNDGASYQTNDLSQPGGGGGLAHIALTNVTTGASNAYAGSFTGNGMGLSNLNAAMLYGTASLSNMNVGTLTLSNQLSDDVITDGITASNYLLLAGGTLTGPLGVADEVYDATAWNGSLTVPTKNAIRDKIESIAGGAGGQATNAVTSISSNTVPISTAATNLHFWAGANVTLNYTNSPEGDVDVTIEASGSGGGLDPRIASSSGTMTAGSNTFVATTIVGTKLFADELNATNSSSLVMTAAGQTLNLGSGALTLSGSAGGFIGVGSGLTGITLDQLSDVTITSAAAGHTIGFNGTVWTNGPGGVGGGGAADGSPGVLTNQFTTNAVGQSIVGGVLFAGLTNSSTTTLNGATTVTASGVGLALRSGSSANYARLSLGRTGNEGSISVINSADSFFYGALAGDFWIGNQTTRRVAIGDDSLGRIAILTDSTNTYFGGSVTLSNMSGISLTAPIVTAQNGYYGRSNVVFHVPTNAPTDGQVVTASGTSGITRWADAGGASLNHVLTALSTNNAQQTLTNILLQNQQGAVTDAQVPDTITAANYLPLAGGILSGQVTSSSSFVSTNGFLVPTNGMGNAVIDFNKPDVSTNCAAAITFTGITNFKQGVANQAIIHLLATGTHTISFPASWKNTFGAGSTYTTTNGVQTDLLVTCQVGLFTNVTKLDYY